MRLRVPERNELPPGLLDPQLPIRNILYEAETPVIYVTNTAQGQLLLAYVADDNADGVFTLLAPVTPEIIAQIERGSAAIRDFLAASWLWLHVSGGNQSGLWTFDIKDVPTECLPTPGVLLRADMEPVLRARAVGQDVVLGRIPASVVSFLADGTRKAMKALLDHIFATPVEGRPRQERRALYDLPIQRFAFSSFELSFAAPEETLIPGDQVREAAQKLELGLMWASTATPEPWGSVSESEREAILRAALFLTPPMAGPISEIHVSGRWIHNRRLRLTRESRRRVRQELRPVDSERIIRYEGRIGELDVDNLSFTLRDTSDGQDRRGFFTDDLLDDMVALLSDVRRVAVAGVERQSRLLVSAVGPVEDAGTPESPPVSE